MNAVDHSAFLRKTQEVSMKHIALIQTYTVDLPTWHAAYSKGINKWGDESRSVEYADWVIENVQGSGLTKDLSSIMRNKDLTMFTMFQTYFSALWAFNRDSVRGFKSGQYTFTDVAARTMYSVVLPTILEEVIRGTLFSDDDNEELKYEELALKIVSLSVMGVPFVNAGANAATSDFGYSISPIVRQIEGVTRIPEMIRKSLDQDEEVTKGLVKSVTKGASAVLGVPGVSQAWATGEHLAEVLVDGEELTLREVVYGPKR